jgi:hypothetical protein
VRFYIIVDDYITAKESGMEVEMRKRLEDEVRRWVGAELQVDIIMNLADIYAEATGAMCGYSWFAGQTGKGQSLVALPTRG